MAVELIKTTSNMATHSPRVRSKTATHIWEAQAPQRSNKKLFNKLQHSVN